MRASIAFIALLTALLGCPTPGLSLGPLQTVLDRAESFRRAGDFEESIHEYQKALVLAQGVAPTLSIKAQLGLLHWNIGRIEESNGYYLEAHTLAVRAGRTTEAARLGDILEIYRSYQRGKEARDAGNLEESISQFRKAVDVSRKIESREHEVKCLRQLSVLYYRQGQSFLFFRLNTEALKLAGPTRLRREEGYCLFNLGIYHHSKGDYPAALDAFTRSYDIAVALSDPADQSSCLLSLGGVHLEIGNFDRAVEKLEAALDIDRKLGDAAQVSQDLNNLGIVYRKRAYAAGALRDYDRALGYYQEALLYAGKSANKNDELKILNNIGSLLTDLDRDLEALEYFKKALTESETHGYNDLVVICLNNLGIINSKLGNVDISIGYYQQAIDMALKYNKAYLWDAYLEIANSYKRQKRYDESLRNYQTAISIIEDLRSRIDLEEYKAAYLGSDKRLEAYLNLVDLLITLHETRPQDGYDLMAFHTLERAKARAFLDSLEVSHIDIGSGLPGRLINREKEILSDISRLHSDLLEKGLSPEKQTSLETELSHKEETYEALKREMRKESPSYASLKYPEIIDVPDARKLLPDAQTAFIIYGLGREGSVAFSLTRKKLVIYRLPDAGRLQEKISDYLGELTDRNRPPSALGLELYETLVAPGLQPGVRNIIFVTDDILNYLPFEALLVSNRPNDRLIVRCGVSYAPSVSSLRGLLHRKRRTGVGPSGDRILLVGDPATHAPEGRAGSATPPNGYFSGSDFGLPALKFSGREIDQIASLYHNRRTDVFREGDATETLVKHLDLSPYRVIHLSAHGLIDDRNPARSAVVLARNVNDEEDGFLQMREVFNLRMNSSLVVLSACDTGLGPHIRGEGLQGLNRAFFYAGADAVLMSLWAVHDEASAQLMARFHAHLRSGKRIAEALRMAKMEMIRSPTLAHPYYWAGFVVTGLADSEPYPRRTATRVTAAALLALVALAVVCGIVLRKKRRRAA